MNKFDPKVLDTALAELAEAAQTARDCFNMGDDTEGRASFNLALSALCKCVAQLSLKNRQYV